MIILNTVLTVVLLVLVLWPRREYNGVGARPPKKVNHPTGGVITCAKCVAHELCPYHRPVTVCGKCRKAITETGTHHETYGPVHIKCYHAATREAMADELLETLRALLTTPGASYSYSRSMSRVQDHGDWSDRYVAGNLITLTITLPEAKK